MKLRNSTWFQRLGERLIERAKRTPYFHLEGYMERFWLWNAYPTQHTEKPTLWQRFMGLFPSARVHHILRSDDDRAYHDHPWPYVTIILSGGYWEWRPVYDKSGVFLWDGCEWHGPGTILFRPAKSWHRLEVSPGKTAWTLFITGRYQQGWGFLPITKTKVPYREFLGMDKKP